MIDDLTFSVYHAGNLTLENAHMTFHEKLHVLTEDRKKRALSRRTGLPADAITAYLSKRHMPSGEVALRLARVLGVSVEWLLDDAQGMPPVSTHCPTTASAA